MSPFLLLYRLFLSSEHLLLRDNASLHYPTFQFIAGHLRFFREFPDWLYPAGVPLSLLANNAQVLVPYRWLGYALAALTPLPLNTCYKISFLVLGVGIFLLGIYLLACRLLHSRVLATLAVVLSLLSSITLIFFHEEQAMGTLFLVPFVWLCGLKSKENPNWIYATAALIGQSMNSHYPQILIIYYALLILFLRPRIGLARGGVALALFLLAAAPVISTYFAYHSQLVSPHRQQTQGIESESYSSYLEMNRLQLASVDPKNLLHYRMKEDGFSPMADLDELVFFITPALPFFLLWLLLLPVAYRRFQMAMIVLLGLLAIGIYGPMPRLLWHLVPGIKLFRQYYYFLPLLGLHLLFVILFVIQSASMRSPSGKRLYFFLFLLLSLSLLDQISWINWAFALFLFLPRRQFAAAMLLILINLPLTYRIWTLLEAKMRVSPSAPQIVSTVDDWYRLSFFDQPINPMISFRGSDHAEFLRRNRLGFLFEDRLANPTEIELEKIPSGFRLNSNRSSGLLTLPSYQDGKWRGDLLSDSSVLRFQMDGKPKEFSRPRSPWLLMVSLSWLATALGLVLAIFPLPAWAPGRKVAPAA